MEYNKALSLSLKMLFIEVAQVYIDNDSVLVVSRPAGAYYSESLQRFTAASGLCLADIQSLFLGQAFAPGKGTATASDGKVFRLAAEPSLSDAEMSVWKATPRKLPAGVDWNFTAIAPVQAEPAVVPQLFALDISAASNTLRCSYAGSGISQAGIIASMMQIEGNVKKRKIDAVISSSMNSAQWNSGTKITRPSIPRNAKNEHRAGVQHAQQAINASQATHYAPFSDTPTHSLCHSHGRLRHCIRKKARTSKTVRQERRETGKR